MTIALLIFLVGLTPPLYSLWMLRRANIRMQIRLSRRTESATTQRLYPINTPSDLYYVHGFGSVIGNIACQYNARSPHIRCAVNPIGPCSECSQYKPTPDDIHPPRE
ncbi:MAG: DUF6464 family protein [Elainellaceae cyanobacterium]